MLRRRADADREDGKVKERRVRRAVGRKAMSVGVLRRWYVRRTLKLIDKSRAKGRRLPDGLAETARGLSAVPKPQREQALEDAILANQDMPNMSREFRRAAARQRLSTRSDTRYRPGRPPGSTVKAKGRPR
jgi:hypothetical protein